VGALTAVAMSAGICGSTAATAAPKEAPLKLEAATRTITAEYWGGETLVGLNLYAVAGRRPFEIRAYRTSYARPISAWQV
jgi:hypothetical protein